MNFIGIDHHVSVLADLRHVFGAFGHITQTFFLGGHAPYVGWPMAKIDELSGDSWCTMAQAEKWNEFWPKYHLNFEHADCFIACYPPIFARLWEGSGKPVICQIPIRYEHGVDNDPALWERWNAWLANKANVILCANNRFDQVYTSAFTDREVLHIPSLCEYTGMRYWPIRDKFLYFAPFKIDNPRMVRKYDVLQAGHGWQAIGSFNGVVHFPYNVSTMSIFEQYTANIPIFVPTKRHLLSMYFDEKIDVLGQWCWNKTCGRAPGSLIEWPDKNLPDPNDYNSRETLSAWLDLADYYDTEWMPHIQYFDSLEHLDHLLATVNLGDISQKMAMANESRRQRVYMKWHKILKEIRNAS